MMPFVVHLMRKKGVTRSQKKGFCLNKTCWWQWWYDGWWSNVYGIALVIPLGDSDSGLEWSEDDGDDIEDDWGGNNSCPGYSYDLGNCYYADDAGLVGSRCVCGGAGCGDVVVCMMKNVGVKNIVENENNVNETILVICIRHNASRT